MNSKGKKIAFVFLAVWLTVVLYIFIHETGHLIVMLLYGEEITEFSILTAHVSGRGGNYTSFGRMWLSANGVLLPYLVSLIYLFFYNKKSKNIFYRLFTYISTASIAGSLIPWIIIPFMYGGNPPVGDDVTNFLDEFSKYCNPIAVSGAATALIAVLIWFIIQQKVVGNAISIIRNYDELFEKSQSGEENDEK